MVMMANLWGFPTNLVGGEPRSFSTAQTTRAADAGATLESMSSSNTTLRVSTSRSTPSTFSATSTLGPSSTLPIMTSSSSMTSNGGTIEGWPLGGSVDEYEKMLQREHQGWTAALRENSQRLPMDGDEGGHQGH